MSDMATIYRLSAATLLQPRTIQRVLRGEPTKIVTRERLARAASELGIELPPAPGAEPPPRPQRSRRRARP
jgi:hypothetical protein